MKTSNHSSSDSERFDMSDISESEFGLINIYFQFFYCDVNNPITFVKFFFYSFNVFNAFFTSFLVCFFSFLPE